MPNSVELLYRIRDGEIPGFNGLFSNEGIQWPGQRPLIMLLRGTEGAGKSTLALELACLGETKTTGGAPHGFGGEFNFKRCVLYYIADDFPRRIENKFQTFVCFADRVVQQPSSLLSDLRSCGNPVTRLEDQHRFLDVAHVSCRDTVVFLINYSGEKSWQVLHDQIMGDVSATSAFQETVVVIDSINSFRVESHPSASLDSKEHQVDASPKLNKGRLPWTLSFFPGLGEKAVVPRPAVIILVDERMETADRDPFLADVCIDLWQGNKRDIDREGGYCERYLQVVKAANCFHVRGPQLFRIHRRMGIEIVPSLPALRTMLHNLRSKENEEAKPTGAIQYVKFGHPELDKLLERQTGKKKDNDKQPEGGALQAGSCNVLVGESGTLKTPFSLYFCQEGIRDKRDKVIFLSLHDQAQTILDFAKDIGGWNGEEKERKEKEEEKETKEEKKIEIVMPGIADLSFAPFGTKDVYGGHVSDVMHCDGVNEAHRFVILHVAPRFIPAEVFIALVRNLLEKLGICPGGDRRCRIVIDSISDLKMAYPRLTGRKAFLSLLVDILRAYGVTSLFIFNESSFESPEDKVIVNLADSVFRFHRGFLEGRSEILLRVEEFANRTSRLNQVASMRRNDDRTIEVKAATEKYYVNKDQQLVPAKLRLYVNSVAPSHTELNRAICRAHDIPLDSLDEHLAIERGESYTENLKNLCERGEYAIIMAIDECCLSLENLKRFLPLDDWIKSEHVRTEDFLGIDKCYIESNQGPYAIPSLSDCSILVCNLQILNRLSCGTTNALRRIENRIKTSAELLRESGDASKNNGLADLLPLVLWEDFIEASKEFYRHLGEEKYRFFGFDSDEDMENMVAIFARYVNEILFRGAGSNNGDNEKRQEDAIGKIVDCLSLFSDVYLPPRGSKKVLDAKPDNCLFYHTWHSKLYPGCSPYLVPVKLGRQWKSTRGGYCWGILKNDLGGDKAKRVLKYATNSTMNLFRVVHRVCMPPQKQFHVNSGELSIYNLGLIRDIYEGSGWSRTGFAESRVGRDKGIRIYHEYASYARALFFEYNDYLQRREYFTPNSKGELKGWLHGFVEILIEHCMRLVQEAQSETNNQKNLR